MAGDAAIREFSGAERQAAAPAFRGIPARNPANPSAGIPGVRPCPDDGTVPAVAREVVAMNRPLSRDQPVVRCFRPEHFRVSAKDPVVDLGGARARDVAFFGPHLRAVLVPDAVPGRPLTAHFPRLARLAPGARADLCVNADAVVVLPLG